VKIAFYKGVSSSGNGSLFDRLIRWWTGCPYSHVELAVSPLDTSDPAWWMCFSSSPRDGGARWKPIYLAVGQWDIVDLDWSLSTAQAQAIRDAALSLTGQCYDWLGILGFVLPFGEQDARRLFCSEAVVRVCQAAGWFPGVDSWRVSPGGLWKMLHGKPY
jgi:hypothetical protein